MWPLIVSRIKKFQLLNFEPSFFDPFAFSSIEEHSWGGDDGRNTISELDGHLSTLLLHFHSRLQKSVVVLVFYTLCLDSFHSIYFHSMAENNLFLHESEIYYDFRQRVRFLSRSYVTNLSLVYIKLHSVQQNYTR